MSLEDDLLARYGIATLLPAGYLERSDSPLEHPVVMREVARAQRIVEGQNFEIRRTLGRYSKVMEEQHSRLVDQRQAILTGDDPPDVWERAAEHRASIVAVAGEEATIAAERAVTLACIDRAWRDHLALCADVREGIHLVRLGGQDPLTTFTNEAIQAFTRIDDEIDAAVLAALEKVRVIDSQIDLTLTDIKTPSATWTYLVNDDPFKNRIGALLTGPGGVTLAMFSTAVMWPLLILWGAVEKLRRRHTFRP